jgi:hypothetical protein
VVSGVDVFDEDPPYTCDIGIITTDVTAAGAGVATAVAFPYYCSRQDVKDVLLELDRSFGTNTTNNNLYDSRLRRFISMAYARINAAMAKGSYQIPATNSTSQTFSSSLTASQNVVTINQVQDGTAFSVGDTVRIHGTTGSVYADEFTNVVAISSDLVDVEFLQKSYDANGTIEIVTVGMEILRHINAQGAALLAMGGLTLGFATSENSKTSELADAFNADLNAIASGELRLVSVPRNTATTYAVKESSDLYNDGGPIFTDGMVF